jgi:hypothetical protein
VVTAGFAFHSQSLVELRVIGELVDVPSACSMLAASGSMLNPVGPVVIAAGAISGPRGPTIRHRPGDIVTTRLARESPPARVLNRRC